MYKFAIVLLLVGCVSNNVSKKQQYEPAFCRNTLQHDIHRNECNR